MLPSARLRTLLYVEDNPANLSLVEQLVAHASDLRLLSARNGNLGIQIAGDSQPDVILMDINLPGLLRARRRSGSKPRGGIPVHLPKPVDSVELTTAIAIITNRPRDREPSRQGGDAGSELLARKP